MALIVAGLPLPEPLPVFVLAVFVVFAVNRFTFFPTELAVTAEAAVLAAAIVAFRHDSAFVGPWCVAFLAGPLDLLHWRQRSFVRMAYNAGNRMVATLAGAASFTILLHSDLLGTGAIRFGAAVLGAALAYASMDGAIGVVLVRLHTGESWLGAARIELPLDALERSPRRRRRRAPATSPPKWVGGPQPWCSCPRSSFPSSRSRGRSGARRRSRGSRPRSFLPCSASSCSRSWYRCRRRRRWWRWW